MWNSKTGCIENLEWNGMEWNIKYSMEYRKHGMEYGKHGMEYGKHGMEYIENMEWNIHNLLY